VIQFSVLCHPTTCLSRAEFVVRELFGALEAGNADGQADCVRVS